MEITKVNIYPLQNSTTILANCSVIFDDELIVKCKVINGKSGAFVSWPQQKGNDDKYYQDAGPIIGTEEETKWDIKNKFEDAIIKEYNKKIGISSNKPEIKKEEPKAEVAIDDGSLIGFKFGPKNKKG